MAVCRELVTVAAGIGSDGKEATLVDSVGGDSSRQLPQNRALIGDWGVPSLAIVSERHPERSEGSLKSRRFFALLRMT